MTKEKTNSSLKQNKQRKRERSNEKNRNNSVASDGQQ